MKLLNNLIHILALLILCAILAVHISASAWLLPLGFGALALLGLAIGRTLAPRGLLYDDIGRGLTMVTALLFFVMPVAYPLAGTGWQAFNPVLPLINVSSEWLDGAVSPSAVALPLVAGAALLIVSWQVYRV